METVDYPAEKREFVQALAALLARHNLDVPVLPEHVTLQRDEEGKIRATFASEHTAGWRRLRVSGPNANEALTRLLEQIEDYLDDGTLTSPR